MMQLCNQDCRSATLPPHQAAPNARLLSRRSALQSTALALVSSLRAGEASAAELAAQAGAGGGGTSGGSSGSGSSFISDLYDRSAAEYDALDGGPLASALDFPALRSQLLAMARGGVLELAVGTGLNLPHYSWHTHQVTSLTAVDISDGMLDQARQRAAAMGLPAGLVTFQQGDAADLPFPPGSYDSIVDTFSLCTFDQPAAALKSAARLLRPQGRLLLLEHARSRHPLVGAYQDLTATTIARTGGRGCVWNQQVPEMVEAAGFEILSQEEHLGGLLVSLEARLVS